MAKRLLTSTLAAFAIFTVTVGVSRADPGEDLRKAQAELQQLQNEQSSVKHDIEVVTAETSKAWEAYNTAAVQLQQAKVNLAKLNAQLDQTQAELKQVNTEIDQLHANYQRQETAFGRRLRALQERGRVSYITVLLGSKNFSDFLTRWGLLKAIVKQDSDVIGDLRGQQTVMQAKSEAVAAHQAQIAQLKADVEVQAATIQKKVNQKAQAAKNLEAQKAQIAARIQQQEQAAQALNDQIARLALMTNHPMGPLKFINPLSPLPVITSAFGWRDNPILHRRTIHWGTDFGAPTGTNVYAVANGIVAHAAYDSVFGNLVVIDHGQDPKGLEVITWYAHNSKLLVSQGQTVKQGEVIALSGSTGWATGAHVHFKVHIGNDRLNPMDYLPGY